MADYKKSVLVDWLKETGNWEPLSAAIQALKAPAANGGWDWNPFDKDDDELGVVGEITNNIVLVKNVSLQAIVSVEKLAREAGLLTTSEDKLEAASDFVANAVKAVMPGYLFFLKPAVKPVVRHVIVLVVDTLNKKFGQNWLDVPEALVAGD